MDKIKVFECFAGIGSQVIALDRLGIKYESVGTSEVDKYAILAYNALNIRHKETIEPLSDNQMLDYLNKIHVGYNFSTNKNELPKTHEEIYELYKAVIENKNYGDIRLIDPNTIPDFNVFTYSFPCKNITNEGKMAGFNKSCGTQSSLVWDCENIIKEKRPEILLMENVKNIICRKNKPVFDEWCKLLESYGYTNYYKVYDTKDYGLPQKRERVLMVSIHKDSNYTFQYPLKYELHIHLEDLLSDEVDEKYYIDPTKTFNDLICVFTNEKGNYVAKVREATKKGYTLAEPGDSINITFYNSKTRRGRVGHGVAQTLTTACQQCTLQNDGRIRYLTPLEYWKLQGLTEEEYDNVLAQYSIPETKMYERAGRMISITVLEAIYKELFKEHL